MTTKNILNNFLRRFGVELHGLSYLRALAKGEFKSNEYVFMNNLFKDSNLVIYDVGANRGFVTRTFLNRFPLASIHAFEPYKPFYEELKNEFEDNTNVYINYKGISNQEGDFIFNINKSIDTSSLLASQTTGLNSDAQVQTVSQVMVPVITLDKYAAICGHRRINVLKLDIQGSELSALKGAADLLMQKMIDIIFCETYFVQQYKDQPLFFDICNYLLQFGYILQDLYHPIYGNGKLAWCDSMFIRNDLIIE